MKKIKLLIIVLVCLFINNVKADIVPPSIASHKVMVTNKSGAICYDDGKKTDKVIPYKTVLELSSDLDSRGYLYVLYNEEGCNVKSSDISALDQSFSLSNEEVEKIEPIKKALILATGGLNMRKGPSVTYGKILTIPQNTIINVTHIAGTFWYYTTYNDKLGWVTGMDNYLGFETKDVLINYEPTKIYSSNGKSVLGTIPANTEITNYLELSAAARSNLKYYVIYNNIKGYVQNMYSKVNGIGKIKLTDDYDINDENGKLLFKMTKGQEIEYTMIRDTYDGVEFYFPAKSRAVEFKYDSSSLPFEYVNKGKTMIKTSGFIGEGLFGEAKLEKNQITDPTKLEKEEDTPSVIEPENKKGITDIIIIGLLAGILLALTALVIIKLVNSKKKKVVVTPKEENIKREEITISDKEIAEARAMIAKELEKEQEEHKEV